MRLDVTSEIGKLKSVLVHLPGREIDVMVPPMMAQLLFDDILFGQLARAEHRRFQQLLRFVPEEVFTVQDLLSKYIFEVHRAFRDACQFKVDFMEGDGQERSPRKGSPTIEGGDVLVARRDLIIVGQTERTNSLAIKQLAKSLRDVNSEVKTVVVVELPKQRSVIHFATFCTFPRPN